MTSTSSEPQTRRVLVIRSTALSAGTSTLSIFACVETLLACSGVVWIGLHGYWQPLFASVSFAPLLLLRSNRSIELGMSAFCSLRRDRHSYEHRSGRYISGAFLAMWGLVLLVGIRVYATLWAAWEQPVAILTQIPHNWMRFALCTDVFHAPEAVAGVEAHLLTHPSDEALRQITIQSLWQRYWSRPGYRSLPTRCLRAFVYLWVFACLFVPSWTLRVSLKASSIVYLPFIYTSKRTSLDSAQLHTRAARILQSQHSLYWALFVLLVLTPVPIVLTSILHTLEVRAPLLTPLMNYLTWYPEIHLWNIARGGCAILTIIIYLIASFTTSGFIKDTSARCARWSARLDATVRVLGIIRGIGIVYVAICGVVLVWQLAGLLDWAMPRFGGDVFPRLQEMRTP